MKRKHPHRQTTRKIVLFISMLLFPITLNYFSPYVIIDGAFQGIINGSLIIFLGMFVSALFVGRLWCAWLCPAGGLQAACFTLNDKPVRGGRYNWIKWGVWVPWIIIIALVTISAGGYTKVDFFHLTDSGISVIHPMSYTIYYAVVGSIFILSITAGKRAFCHYGCWMAPFMILGRKARNAANTPALLLSIEPEKCIQCQKCTRGCPMSLSVHTMVATDKMENSECILCGNCIDVCPKDVIHYSFSRTSSAKTQLQKPSHIQ